MTLKRTLWASLVALLAGFGIGLAYAWVLSPVQYLDATPRMLRNDFKDSFRSAIAAAYFSNPDLERARARLSLLGDADPYQALSAQAQRMLAAGEPPETVQKVAFLASALQGAQPVAVESVATESPIPLNSPEPAAPLETQSSGPETKPPAGTETPALESPEPVTQVPASSPTALLTPKPRPSQTPTATLGAPYQLVGQDTVCDPVLEQGLLQIVVTDLTRQQIPGAEIIITWNSGEEHIFTGMKPELGNGYADFVMTPEVVYSVRMADGGTQATEISSPGCKTTEGEAYRGGVRVTFQQP